MAEGEIKKTTPPPLPPPLSPFPNPFTNLAPHQTQFLTTLLLLFSIFINGVLWTKVQLYEKGGTPTSAQKEAPLSTKNLNQYAKETKLNTAQFDKCVADGKYKNQVDTDLGSAQQLGANGTPTFFINGKFIGGAYPFTIFKEIIDKELAGKGSTNYKDYSTTLQQAYEDPRGKGFDPQSKTVDIANAPAKGDKNAPVTVVELSDFECPYCGNFFTQTLPQIEQEYIQTGKIRLVYKQLPLSQIHPHARGAAEASLCANEQGKFWEYHNRLFSAMQQGS